MATESCNDLQAPAKLAGSTLVDDMHHQAAASQPEQFLTREQAIDLLGIALDKVPDEAMDAGAKKLHLENVLSDPRFSKRLRAQ